MHAPPDFAVEGRAAGLTVLQAAYEQFRLRVAGSSLPFAAETAWLSAAFVARACWMLANEENQTLLLKADPVSAADHLSADLCLRFSPRSIGGFACGRWTISCGKPQATRSDAGLSQASARKWTIHPLAILNSSIIAACNCYMRKGLPPDFGRTGYRKKREPARRWNWSFKNARKKSCVPLVFPLSFSNRREKTCPSARPLFSSFV